MSTKLEQIICDLQQLSKDELKVVYKVLLKQLAIPLQEPEMVFDDWNDSEVDASYAEELIEARNDIKNGQGIKAEDVWRKLGI